MTLVAGYGFPAPGLPLVVLDEQKDVPAAIVEAWRRLRHVGTAWRVNVWDARPDGLYEVAWRRIAGHPADQRDPFILPKPVWVLPPTGYTIAHGDGTAGAS